VSKNDFSFSSRVMRRTRVRRIITLSPTRYRSITWKDKSRLEIIKRLRIANRYRNFKVSIKKKKEKKSFPFCLW